MENNINNLEEKLEWWETFDGIVEKMKEMKETNDLLNAEILQLRKDIEGKLNGKG